jgi:hypothetical protein
MQWAVRYFHIMQDAMEANTHTCSPHGILQLHLETRTWGCVRPAADGVQFRERIGQSGVFLPNPTGSLALLVWGGLVQHGGIGSDWHEVDFVLRYASDLLMCF